MTLTNTNIGDRAVQPAAGLSLHRQGLSGLGVGIAVIDSGVSAPDEFGSRLVIGPDFTVDAGTEAHGLDHTGHGTHLAGIAAGANVGVAPGSHVVSLKVAHKGGATDVGAVIEAIEFTIAHRHQLSIGVLLLAFGADQLPAGEHDPLAAAVARAWRAGIVVVTSSGNGGQDAPLSTPTHIDEVLTVAGVECTDGHWTLCDFSDRGVDGCRPDIAAPAKSIVGPVALGSEAATSAPESSFVGDGFVKGSGTSQAAAVVAGAVALLLEADPSLTPDEVKHALAVSAVRMGEPGAGAGALDLDVALACLGSGLFRDADVRWTADLVPAGLEWSSVGWRSVGWRSVGWRSVGWRSVGWRSVGWRSVGWRGQDWSSVGWRGLEWSSVGWRSVGWRGQDWSSVGWRGLEWSSVGWRGLEWSSVGWRSVGWRSVGWRGQDWSSVGWRGLEWSSVGWRSVGWRGQDWSSVGWRGLEWSSVGWRGLEWSSVGWRSVGWRSVGWRGQDWSSVGWRGLEWSSVGWRSVGWRGQDWSSVGWRGLEWSSVGWRSVGWRGLEWSSVGWRSVGWRGLEWSSVGWR